MITVIFVITIVMLYVTWQDSRETYRCIKQLEDRIHALEQKEKSDMSTRSSLHADILKS